jgi:quinol monooxygenase YgiN
MAVTLLMVASATGGTAMAADEQKPVTVIVLFKVSPGMESAFKKAAVQTIAASRAEEGCVSYAFNQSVDDPTEFSVSEIWRSKSDNARHEKSAHIKAFGDTVPKMLAPGQPPVVKEYQSFDK